MDVSFKLHGIDELKAMLDRLPVAVDRRIASNALRAGARIMKTAIRQAAPEGDTGRLKSSVKVITGKSSKRSERVVHVGLFGKASSLGHLIEYGTVPIRRSTSGKKLVFVVNNQVFFRDQVKGVTAKPFLRRAVERVANQALAEIGRVLGEGIVKEASKDTAKFRK